MNSNVAIFVSTFGKKIINIKYAKPIEVGSSLRTDFNYELKDNTGKSISDENPYYAELTGLYWIWQNYPLNDDDIVGFCNYNKALKLKDKDYEDIENHKYDFITFEPIKIVAHSKPEEIDAVEKILKNNYPDYYVSWSNLYNHDGSSKDINCRFANTFLTNGKEFKEYSKFLFAFLKDLRKEIGDLPDESANDKRYCAYISERMLSVYIDANHKKTKAVSMINKQGYLNILNKISTKLNLNRESKLYLFLKSKFGYKSSYKDKK